MDRKAVIAIVIVALACFALFAVSNPIGFFSLEGEKPVKLGLLVPLTGSTAAIGEDVRNAVTLAFEDSSTDIELVVEDSECKPAEAVTAFNKLVETDNVSAVFGVVCSGVAKAIGPIAEEKGVPTILAVASAYKPEKEGSYVFKFWPTDKERAGFEANIIIEKLGAKDIALIYVNNAMGSNLKEQFEKEAEKIGIRILVLEAFNPEETDFRTSLLKIKDSEPDAVFVIAYEPSAINILKQAKELGIETQFLATSAVISEGFLKSVGGIGEGLIVDLPVTTSEKTREFEARMAERFDDSILHPGSYFAYDSLMLLAEIAQKTGEREKIKDELYKARADGISGLIKFNDFGQNKEKKEFGAFVVRDGEFVEYRG